MHFANPFHAERIASLSRKTPFNTSYISSICFPGIGRFSLGLEQAGMHGRILRVRLFLPATPRTVLADCPTLLRSLFDRMLFGVATEASGN